MLSSLQRALFVWLLAAVLPCLSPAYAADGQQDYLYFRDVNVPPFQKLHEFFDLPDRSGKYEVTMVSDSLGPLTFHVIRVRDEKEQTVSLKRSYRMSNHDFHALFDNKTGTDDLIVEIANSNPAVAAKVSVFVVELP